MRPSVFSLSRKRARGSRARLRIALLHNIRPGRVPRGEPRDMFEEFDTPETIRSLRRALERNGRLVVPLEAGTAGARRLTRPEFDLVFNIAEGRRGPHRESLFPRLMDRRGLRYTGSGPRTLSLCLNKAAAKRRAARAGVPTPRFRVLRGARGPASLRLSFPVILKPVWEGSSIGIRRFSRVETPAALRKACRWFRLTYPAAPILAEEFIDGREFTVGLLGTRSPRVIGVMEVVFRKQGLFYSLEVKRDWRRLCRYRLLKRGPLARRLASAARRVHRAVGARDMSRVDFRVAPDGRLYFLEINPLPGLSPVYSDFVILARKAGWAYTRLVNAIVNQALTRLSR